MSERNKYDEKIKKIVGLVLSLCLTFGAFSSVVSFAAEEVGTEKAYEKNLESFYTSLRFKEDFAVISIRECSQTSELVYPDNFGGLYIDSDNELHIAYTDNKETLMNKVGEDEAIFEKVDYSYNYLNGIFEYITALMCAGETSVSQAYVDETTNRVAVCLETSLREELVNVLKEHISDFDENAISFRETEVIVTTAATGTGIKVTNGTATAGYNAQDYNGNYGFVTCGHGFVQFTHSDGATRVLISQVQLNTNQQRGDSGCAVVYSGNVVGIATVSNLSNAAWVSKAENINSRFDLSVYLAA